MCGEKEEKWSEWNGIEGECAVVSCAAICGVVDSSKTLIF